MHASLRHASIAQVVCHRGVPDHVEVAHSAHLNPHETYETVVRNRAATEVEVSKSFVSRGRCGCGQAHGGGLS